MQTIPVRLLAALNIFFKLFFTYLLQAQESASVLHSGNG